MSEKYKETFRGYLVDNHSPDSPVVTLEHLNADEFEQFFLESHINHLMLYCKDHWGNSYYDTKIGKLHNGLKEDWVGRIVPILRKHDIEFNAYYCFEYDQYAPTSHPEWATKMSNGEPLVCGAQNPDATARWGIPCYETGYRDYILGQLKEIIEKYRPDSLFIDIFGKSLCYCDVCRRQFRDRYGYDLPEDDQGLMEHNNDIVQFLDLQAEQMLDEVKDNLKKIDPDLAVTVNFASHYPKEIRDKLDYIFTEPWAGNWLSGAYARDTSGGKYPQLGPGDVSQVYNYKNDAVYELAAAEIAAQGCRVFMYSEPMHYDGSLDFTEAEKIGKAYREVEKFESCLSDRELLADIAIIQSDTADSLIVEHPVIARCIGRAREGGLHRKALLGAMEICDYSKYTWQVVPELELTLSKMKQYKLIILPNLFYVRETLKRDLEEYVKGGGCIFVSGETGIYDHKGELQEDFTLKEMQGCHFVRKNTKYQRNVWSAYIDQTDDNVWKYCEKTTPPVWHYILETESAGANILGTFRFPAVELTDTQWVNWGYPLPGKETPIPAVYENSYGDGSVLQCCFAFFDMQTEEFQWVKKFFQGVLDKYITPSVYLETENKNILEYTCYDRKASNELILHELSKMAEITCGDTPNIPGGQLILNIPGKQIKSVQMFYPDQKEIPFIQKEGQVCCWLDDLRIHSVYKIKY
ncbi:MAG: beta-galactosidase trimerization domain-containing protein [Eubacteriales bacterium]|nr:beta-galactosidase trimerization domain-containing protein [Eubacteriales bacterium]